MHQISNFFLLSALPLIAILAAVLSGIFGIGGGFFVVPFLNFLLSTLYPELDNTMVIATTTSLVNILVVNGLSMYHRVSIIEKHYSDMLWTSLPCAMGSVMGAVLSKLMHDDVLQVIFAVFLIIALVVKLSRKYLLKVKLSNTVLWPVILLVSIICSMCGVGVALILFPVMIAWSDEKIVASAICSFNSCVLSLSALVTTWFFPNSYTHYPFFYEDVYLPMIVFAICLTPYFSRVGIRLNAQLSERLLINMLIAIIATLIAIQVLTL